MEIEVNLVDVACCSPEAKFLEELSKADEERVERLEQFCRAIYILQMLGCGRGMASIFSRSWSLASHF